MIWLFAIAYLAGWVTCWVNLCKIHKEENNLNFVDILFFGCMSTIMWPVPIVLNVIGYIQSKVR
jgi:hypothetical protein